MCVFVTQGFQVATAGKSKFLSPAKIAAGVKTKAERKAERQAALKAVRAEQVAVAARVKKSADTPAKRAAQKASAQHPLMIDGKTWNKMETMKVICRRIASSSMSLSSICATPYVDDDGNEWEMPDVGTVIDWKMCDQEIDALYVNAKSHQTDMMAESILEIADDGRNDSYIDGEGKRRTDMEVVQRSKLRVEARQWLMERLKPRRYAVRNSAPDIESPEELARKIREAAQRMDEVTGSE